MIIVIIIIAALMAFVCVAYVIWRKCQKDDGLPAEPGSPNPSNTVSPIEK